MTNELPPTAFAPTVDVVVEVEPVRCAHCDRMLAELATAPWRMKCNRCGALNWATADGTLHASEPTKNTRALTMKTGDPNGKVRGVTGPQAHD